MNPGDRSAPLRLRVFAALALSALFLVVYGATNALAAGRSDLPALQLSWETKIPLVPWMIVPYMSIDLFFVAAPLLCRRRDELRAHVRRIGTATLVAGAVFAIFPMRLAVERPEMPGVFGAIHGVLVSYDEPYNLFPSLHVAYLLLLWPLFAQRLRGAARRALHAWLALVLLSVLFVRQHHVVDMIGGAVLALGCWLAVPGGVGTVTAGGLRARRLGIGYLLGATVTAGVALVGSGFALFALVLLWPAAALALVGGAYLGLGPDVFDKRGGRLSAPARIVLAPYLLGLHLSRRWWWRRDDPRVEVVPGLWIGRVPTRREAGDLAATGVDLALDLTAEHSSPRVLARQASYRNVPIMDRCPPTAEQLRAVVECAEGLDGGGSILAFCGLGYERSAAAAAALLLATRRARTVAEACALVRRARPRARFSPEVVRLLDAHAGGHDKERSP